MSVIGGWNPSVTGYVAKYVGLTTDFSGHYGSSAGEATSRYSYMFGPVVAFRTQKFTPFAHALLGGVTENVPDVNISSYTTFAQLWVVNWM
jgi:hypothetical protein